MILRKEIVIKKILEILYIMFIVYRNTIKLLLRNEIGKEAGESRKTRVHFSLCIIINRPLSFA